MGNKPIVHAPIATGSTEPRDIRDRFADFINLKDFGAVGDGVTDDSSAWGAWKTALQSGGTPYIPSGNYLLGEEVIHAPKGYLGENKNVFSFNDDGAILETFSSTIYVDAENGSDANAGLSESESFATLSKAVEVAKSTPKHGLCKLIVAAGTYQGGVTFSGVRCEILLGGNVVLNGGIFVTDKSYIRIEKQNSEDSVSLTIQNSSSNSNRNEHLIYVTQKSLLRINEIPIYIIAYNVESAVMVEDYSFLGVIGAIAFTCSNVGYAVYIISFSFLYCAGLSNTGSIDRFLYARKFCECCIYGNVSSSESVAVKALDISDHSYVFLNGGVINIYSTSTLCEVHDYSSVYFEQYTNCSLTRKSDFNIITCSRHSLVYFNAATGGTLNLALGNSTLRSCFDVFDLSEVCISSGGIKFSGKCAQTVICRANSYTFIAASCTITGSITGKRYVVDTNSLVGTGNAGANRIPGNTAGTTSNGGIYY